MKTNLLHLDSVVPNGVGGPEAGMISLIYSFLLSECGLDFYKYIHINQIGDDLDEVIINKGKEVYINIRYPAHSDFNLKNAVEKNIIRLEIVHAALLRIAAKNDKINVDVLGAIKERIIKSNFLFEIIYNAYHNKKKENLIAKVIIQPASEKFNFYVTITDDQMEKCRILIYEGKPTDYYVDDLFYYGKWKNENEFILSGKQSEIEFHFFADKCIIELINKSENKNSAPVFNLYKTGAGEKDLQDYINSLNPGIAAVIVQSQN